MLIFFPSLEFEVGQELELLSLSSLSSPDERLSLELLAALGSGSLGLRFAFLGTRFEKGIAFLSSSPS